MADIMGAPFGSKFELAGEKLIRMAPTSEDQDLLTEATPDDEDEDEVHKDNRNLVSVHSLKSNYLPLLDLCVTSPHYCQ